MKRGPAGELGRRPTNNIVSALEPRREALKKRAGVGARPAAATAPAAAHPADNLKRRLAKARPETRSKTRRETQLAALPTQIARPPAPEPQESSDDEAPRAPPAILTRSDRLFGQKP